MVSFAIDNAKVQLFFPIINSNRGESGGEDTWGKKLGGVRGSFNSS